MAVHLAGVDYTRFYEGGVQRPTYYAGGLPRLAPSGPAGPVYTGAVRVGRAFRFGVSENRPRGLAWDGTTMYMLGGATFALYTLNRTTGVATRVGSANQFGVSNLNRSPYDLAWDGTTMYMVGNNRLYTINRTTGVATLVATMFGVDPRGLAWDGTTMWYLSLIHI